MNRPFKVVTLNIDTSINPQLNFHPDVFLPLHLQPQQHPSPLAPTHTLEKLKRALHQEQAATEQKRVRLGVTTRKKLCGIAGRVGEREHLVEGCPFDV